MVGNLIKIQYFRPPTIHNEMISFLKGLIAYKNPTYIIIEANGIGYHVNISLNTYSQIEKLEKVKLFTHLHVKEDSHTLYGFAEPFERHVFVHLISVSGIGPNTARVVLSYMNAEDVRGAILSENVSAFQAVKGIGAKTAKRIILDLKDKFLKDGGQSPSSTILVDNSLRNEALSALVSLGFNKNQVQKTLNKLWNEVPNDATVESIIKGALKQLT